jgi:hypothetical protein
MLPADVAPAKLWLGCASYGVIRIGFESHKYFDNLIGSILTFTAGHFFT